MSKSKKLGVILGVCAAAMSFGGALPQVHAQNGQVTTAKGFVSSVSIQADAGVVAIKLSKEVYSGEDMSVVPVILCAGASTEEGQRVAYVPDLPAYRTLLDVLLEDRSGTIETREGRDGRCYVTRYTEE